MPSADWLNQDLDTPDSPSPEGTSASRPAEPRANHPRIEAKGFRFHDLRHTGNTLAASSGASTRELMHRMGHGSMRAALIYQHVSSQRDREIAAAIDARIGRSK